MLDGEVFPPAGLPLEDVELNADKLGVGREQKWKCSRSQFVQRDQRALLCHEGRDVFQLSGGPRLYSCPWGNGRGVT